MVAIFSFRSAPFALHFWARLQSTFLLRTYNRHVCFRPVAHERYHIVNKSCMQQRRDITPLSCDLFSSMSRFAACNPELSGDDLTNAAIAAAERHLDQADIARDEKQNCAMSRQAEVNKNKSSAILARPISQNEP